MKIKPIALRILALLLALSLFGTLAACKKEESPETSPTGDTSPDPSTPETTDTSPTPETPASSDRPLVIAHGDMNGKFSPFTAESAYDMEIVDMVLGQSFISYDRLGELVYDGIAGETRSYNGTEYFYNGIADGEVIYDEAADITTYKLTLREGVTFSDGVELTIDDVIFSFYVFADPTYTGAATFFSVPIIGMTEYREGYTNAKDALMVIPDAIIAAGPGGDGTGSDVYTPEQYADFWARYNDAYAGCVQGVIDTCVAVYSDYAEQMLAGVEAIDLANPGMQVAFGIAAWNFGGCEEGVLTTAAGTTFDLNAGEFPTLDDYIAAIDATYEGSFAEASAAGEFADLAGTTPYNLLVDLYIGEMITANPDLVARTATRIEGIKKTGKYSLEITVQGFDASAVFKIFGNQATALHYYGDTSKYDYDNDKFGFEYGDLSFLNPTESVPIGVGPYKFVKFENKVVYLEANENYWKGAPLIKEVQYKVTGESDTLPGIETATIDIGNLSMNKSRVDQIKGINPNGELSGEIIHYNAIKFLGYGYIGLNAKNVSVGGERGSEASKNLRRGIATILAAYRDLTVNSFYGELASVLNYPMSEVSWAAPQRTDAGYRVAYTLDVNGNEIYSTTMTDDERYAAAEQAALGYLEAAGYTVTNGVVTAAPAGGRMDFSVWVSAGGEGDHPSFLLLTKAKESLERIGIVLEIRDLPTSSSSELWDGLDAETVDIWCAAWQATIDPDIYQLYHSSGVVGKPNSNGSNHYGTDSPELDEAIMETRGSPDTDYRKEAFRAAFDIIMDWGVEVPIYQRNDCYVFSEERVDTSTLPGDITSFYGWIMEVEKMAMK